MEMELVARAPRSVALRLPAPGALYHLPRPRAWRLTGGGLDRQGVTDTWTDPQIRRLIEAKGIQLISYRDLKTD